nr:RNA-directed DNA polymerase, eukaryota [Tanacetum cinerariifolium]
MQTYWALLFFLPKTTIKEIDSILKSFLWSQGEKINGKSKIATKNVCKPKQCGGLGFKPIEKWNEVLMIKHMWNVASKKDSLWVRWVNIYMLKGRNVREVPSDDNGSWEWKKLTVLVSIVMLLWQVWLGMVSVRCMMIGQNKLLEQVKPNLNRNIVDKVKWQSNDKNMVKLSIHRVWKDLSDQYDRVACMLQRFGKKLEGNVICKIIAMIGRVRELGVRLVVWNREPCKMGLLGPGFTLLKGGYEVWYALQLESGDVVDGDWNTDPEVVKDVFKDHFVTRFKQPAHGRLKLNISFTNRLSTDQVADIDRSVSRGEIRVAVWNCGENKSPGPDGYTFEFFRRYWRFIGSDFCSTIECFFESGSFPKESNSSFIALIPKVTDAKFVTDFRPISLIGCVYKVLKKILANRLATVISDLVSDIQSAFVANRKILDGSLILNELLAWGMVRL